MSKGVALKKLVVGSDGVAAVVDPGGDEFNQIENPSNVKALKNRMFLDYEEQAKRLHCSVTAMPLHAVKAALNGIYWKHRANWPGSQGEYITAFKDTFKGQLAVLEAAGQKADIGASIEAPKKPSRNELRGRLWGEILQLSQDKFQKHPDKLTMHEFENLKADVRAKGVDHLRELNRWARAVHGERVTVDISAKDKTNADRNAYTLVKSIMQSKPDLNVSEVLSEAERRIGRDLALELRSLILEAYDFHAAGCNSPSTVSDSILAEVNKVEEINENLKKLTAELSRHETAWLRIAGQPAIKLHNPQVRVGDDNKLRIGHSIGANTFIPAWETDLETQPLVEVRMDSPDLWTLMARRDKDATVTISLESSPVTVSMIKSDVGARDPWNLHSNDETF